MIIFDNIVSTLQHTGGISVLFSEIENRLTRDRIAFERIDFNASRVSTNSKIQKSRLLERYRPCSISSKIPAVFHSTYYRTPANKKNLITVTTVHDFTYERFVGGLKRAVHSVQKNYAIRNSDAIICVSQNTKNDLLEFVPGTSPDKIHVIHNGVSDTFTPLFRAPKNQVLFVGQRGRYKNFSSVVKALSMIRDTSISCVGGGPFTKSELLFLEQNIPGRYIHLGYVTAEQLNSEYNNSIALVYPSLYEGFGIPILEAMRAGCPVIAVHSSSIPEVAGNAAILLNRGTPDEIKTAIESLSQNNNRDALAELGLLQSRNFSWESTFNKTLALYNNFLDNSPHLT